MKKFYTILIILFSASLIYWMYYFKLTAGTFTDPAIMMGAIILVYLSVIGILLSVLLRNRN